MNYGPVVVMVIHSKKHGTRDVLLNKVDYDKLSRYRWCVVSVRPNGKPVILYVKREKKLANGKYKTVYLHNEIMQTPKGMLTDHVNRNTLDNRRVNLRVATFGQNGYNSVKQKGTSSKYKGVSWNKRAKRWEVYISVNGKIRHLGYFPKDKEDDAARAYNKAAKKYHGEFALLNVVQGAGAGR